ncbi:MULTISPECIES: hypothetical protein [Bacillus cereus group]|nr:MULTISPECIES: hypothetical protein [Bacillus cereus group]MCU5070078.1 hypothetical protein [Bacillus pacificus]MED0977886.1 hypothetical protein [Bacillus paranthracis]MED1138905.1 hypothetical protein [Bacillus paranthracis]
MKVVCKMLGVAFISVTLYLLLKEKKELENPKFAKQTQHKPNNVKKK